MYERTKKRMNVQSLVEEPEIYIFSHCGDTITEKLSLIEARRDDIADMKNHLEIEGVKVKDTMRFFQGILVFQWG